MRRKGYDQTRGTNMALIAKFEVPRDLGHAVGSETH